MTLALMHPTVFPENVMDWLIWGIAALATGGVILRPFQWPEAVWAVAGALALVPSRLLPLPAALAAVGRGTDVYLFLTGMMLLSELARREGLFEHVAAVAARRAGGSARRLFALVYAVGVVVTTFLSNDATAVVLTPAVYAAARAADAEPLPYLFACAFIANAASFVLPISNPANLVIFDAQMPPLLAWLARFALPSVLSIAATYAMLRLCLRAHLRETVKAEVQVPALSATGRLAACGIGATALVLIGASAANIQLGLPTCLAGIAATALVLLIKREAPWGVLAGISWLVLPLVAGLFVLVEGLARTGVIHALAMLLEQAAQRGATLAAWGAGVVLAFACNAMNNLPAGLVAGMAVRQAHVPVQVTSAVLIGVDLGPNLSVTGSLATILWLVALRREGQSVTAWRFLKLGCAVMPPALILALAGLMLR
jgi:arsenical pump membrane protein